MTVLPHARWRQALAILWQRWQTDAPHLSGEAIATALLTAQFCQSEQRRTLALELVWTGPDGRHIPPMGND